MDKNRPFPGKPGDRPLLSGLAAKTFDKDALLFSSVCLVALVLVLLTVLNTLYSNSQYVSLAASFLRGRLDFVDPLRTWVDASLYNGKYYWPQGLLPAVLLIPFFLVFQYRIDTGHIGLVLTFLIIWFLYKIALRMGVSKKTARWLSFAFVFATSFSFVNYFSTWPWYFCNVLSFFLMTLAIYEWLTRKRLFLVGLLVGLSMATRPLTCFAILSFTGLLLFEPRPRSAGVNGTAGSLGIPKTVPRPRLAGIIGTWTVPRPLRAKIRPLAELLLPFGLIGLVIILYNAARFGSIAEFGYNYQIMSGEGAGTRDYGAWSLQHIPMNIYYLLLKGLDGVFIPGTKVLTAPYVRPDVWGTSLLLTSPILLFTFRADTKNPLIRAFLLNTLIILVVVLTYSSTGMITYGNRYVLDFLPLLFPAFVTSFQEPVSGRVKALIIFSFLFNFVMSLLVFTSPV